MDWRAANEKQQEALWRIFLMFVAMAVVVIRTGLVSRGVIAVLSIPEAEQDDAPAVNDQPQPLSPDDLREIILVLLCLAEAAGRMLIRKEHTVWELMNRPLPQPTQERPLSTADQCERPARRIDTS